MGTYHVDIDNIAPVDVNLAGTVGVNLAVTSLPIIHLAIDSLPKINIGIDPIRIILDPLRAHLPVDMSVGVNLLGHDVLCVRLCGEAMISTEPVKTDYYIPNPCERCDSKLVLNVES
jgi:hypothetical protein